jgi:acetyl esterase
MNKPFVRPDVRTFLEMLEANPRPLFTAEMLAQLRTMATDGVGMLDLPIGELAVDRTLTMPGPAGDIGLRLFDARAERAAGPLMVFYHGGGFCLGSIATHAPMAAEFARVLDVPVVSVEYRLAPEDPWPAGPDDAEAAARWVAGNEAALGRSATGLILCGDSAGATLTIVTAMALRNQPAAKPVLLQIPFYPVTDSHADTASRKELADGYGLDSANMKLYDEHYAPDIEHWRASPLLADQSGMPPTLLVTAALDPLRDEGRAYAAATAAAGVPTTFREIEGTVHGFACFRRAIPSAQQDLTRILTIAKAMIEEVSG